jgi:hypothetical protein
MITFPNSPHTLKGGIVLLDPESARIHKVISLQYNPESLSRSLQVQGFGESGDRSQALRLRGPAVETIKLDAEIDAADQLEFPEENRSAVEHGIQPQLAVLEALVHPTSGRLKTNNDLASLGTLEIIPMEAPLSLFVWSKNRIVPVRITDFSITEEAFDITLNPIRAKVSLGMRVLSVDDLGFSHTGGRLFMNYLQTKERLAENAQPGAMAALGIKRIE